MEDYFRSTYSTCPRTFEHPSWMPQPPLPTVPVDTVPFNFEEIEAVISRTRSNSSPSPLDQVPYTVLKHCPSLMPALLHLYNTCWANQVTPAEWKVETIQLLGKSKAEQDPSQPSHFRPIALTPCIGKVFSSLLKQRWLSYMLDKHYLDTTTQKAFVDGISGCTEHHLKLLSIIKEARRSTNHCVLPGWTWPMLLAVSIMASSVSHLRTTMLHLPSSIWCQTCIPVCWASSGRSPGPPPPSRFFKVSTRVTHSQWSSSTP